MPDVSSFKVFDSPSWALIPYEKRKAMEKKTTNIFLLLWVHEGLLSLYPTSNKVLFLRYVHFDENINLRTSFPLSSSLIIDNFSNHYDAYVDLTEE